MKSCITPLSIAQLRGLYLAEEFQGVDFTAAAIEIDKEKGLIRFAKVISVAWRCVSPVLKTEFRRLMHAQRKPGLPR